MDPPYLLHTEVSHCVPPSAYASDLVGRYALRLKALLRVANANTTTNCCVLILAMKICVCVFLCWKSTDWDSSPPLSLDCISQLLHNYHLFG